MSVVVKWDQLDRVKKTSVVVNYVVAAIFLWFFVAQIRTGGMGFISVVSGRCPECVFHLLLALAFTMIATSELVELRN